ncbi:MAG: sulfatase-like hydrolase/transferase, partial [Candidatus Sumerlaeota bacterium]|nr:sulfatase-like hydrolase/transferase [Candidatus Sumerlaeota bacterium]
LDALEELGLAENTVILWTTDHGDALACHGGHFDKRSYMPEEMVRIPMALRWPGRIAAGQTSQRLVGTLDVAPTLLDAAGLSFSQPVDGASVLPLCFDSSSPWRDAYLCETHGHAENVVGRLVVADRYKYIATQGQMHELYDLQEDPYEMNNLIDAPAHQGILADMQARLASCQRETNDKADGLN